jgi:hypothetical protein
MACTKKKLSSSSRSGCVRWSLISSMRIEDANSSVLRASSTSWPITPRCSSTARSANRKKRVTDADLQNAADRCIEQEILWVTPATVMSRQAIRPMNKSAVLAVSPTG